jgi:hypothetical protein
METSCSVDGHSGTYFIVLYIYIYTLNYSHYWFPFSSWFVGLCCPVLYNFAITIDMLLTPTYLSLSCSLQDEG